MNDAKLRVEVGGKSTTKALERANNVVFQPQKLKEVVEIVDLMGKISSRVREDNSGDLPVGAGAGATTQTGQAAAGQSTRDQAIAKAPPIPIMQRKIVRHLEREVRTLQHQAMVLSRSKKRGSAYLLAELYKRIRRLSLVISDMMHASAAMIRRFYISVFIDHQPLIVPGGRLAGMEEEIAEE